MSKMLKTLKNLFFLIFFTSAICSAVESPYEGTANLPVIANGRISPLNVAAKVWLFDYYHRGALKTNDLNAFNANDTSALSLIWNMHFLKDADWSEAPFFWVHYAHVKKALDLNPLEDRFNFKKLHQALYENEESSLFVIKELVASEFIKAYQENTSYPVNKTTINQRMELKNLSKGLFVNVNGGKVTILSAPSSPPWNFLKSGMVIIPDIQDYSTKEMTLNKQNSDEFLKLFQALKSFQEFNRHNYEDNYVNLFKQLEAKGLPPSQIGTALEEKFPLTARLKNLKGNLNMLPLKNLPGTYLSLHAFNLKVYQPSSRSLELCDNFTIFADEDFYSLRDSYQMLEDAANTFNFEKIEKASQDFSKLYLQAYESLREKPHTQANGKALFYPSKFMLFLESFVYNFPIIECAIAFYCIALGFSLLSSKHKAALFFLILGFIFHTAALGFRSYVLQRPPVSNMFETVVYVPYVGLIFGFIIYMISKSRIALTSAIALSIALLILLKITQLDMKLENVQAVLDSQYWLIVHVLMIVGSYGAFLVCGIIAHVYLMKNWLTNYNSQDNAKLAKAILHTMYIGVALLIPGTILGGVWAAESWGRFWDWDPKESWAFITACIYVLIIHAHTFKYIGEFGLSIGAVFGMVAVSFTWYGVNYILGTGLHTYGFGKGGEFYYFIYLGIELAFILTSFGALKLKSLPKH